MQSNSSITLACGEHQLAAVCLNPQGAGEPVMLLHGITSSLAFWQVNPAPYMLEIGPCYSLSLPAHAPAVAPAGFRDSVLTAVEIVQLLDEAIHQLVGAQPVTLMGHSTGGFAALSLAAYRPERVRRVVSISGFAHGRWTGILGQYQRALRLGWPGVVYFKLMFRLLNLHPALYRWAMRFYAADARALYAHPDLPDALDLLYPYYRRLDLDALLPYFRCMPDIDISGDLSRIQVPALIIAGTRDPIVPPEQSRRIAGQIPGAELVMLDGAGHMPFLERHEPYHAAVSRWLAS
ncbi:MAG: alpha/beta hydrolase [Anaerolineae bacterium]|nr:alpha/beta hydrolase [Anaerolineae bacterium]